MAETIGKLESLPESTVRVDRDGRYRIKALDGLWYRVKGAGKRGRTGIASHQMPHADTNEAQWMVQDVLAQFDAHPYRPQQAAPAVTPVRLSVNLAPSVAEALRATAAAQGVNLTEAVRRAVALYAELHKERAAGRTLLSKDGTGKKAVFYELIPQWQDPDRA